MKKNRKYLFYAMGMALFIALKLIYVSISIKGLLFILGPTNYFVSLITNSNSTFIEHLGYFHQDLNIAIEKSCSGFNFLLLSFLITYCSSVSYLKSIKSMWIAMPISLVFCWMITLFVNTSRITTSILIGKWAVIPKPYHLIAHQAEGTFIYLSFLILSYKLINHLLKTYACQHEKLA